MGEPLVGMAARLRSEAEERSQLERLIAEHTEIPPSVRRLVQKWASAWDDIRERAESEPPPTVAVEGCTEEEILEIAQAQHTPLPVRYVEFLSVMGKSAGNLWMGSVWLYPHLLRLKDLFLEELVRLGHPFEVPDGSLVVWMDQGYQYAWMLPEPGNDDPEVWFWSDSETSPRVGWPTWDGFLLEGEADLNEWLVDLRERAKRVAQ